jgi:hypothetical protein
MRLSLFKICVCQDKNIYFNRSFERYFLVQKGMGIGECMGMEDILSSLSILYIFGSAYWAHSTIIFIVSYVSFSLYQRRTRKKKSEILVIFIWATHGHQAPSGNHLFRPPLRPRGSVVDRLNFGLLSENGPNKNSIWSNFSLLSNSNIFLMV